MRPLAFVPLAAVLLASLAAPTQAATIQTFHDLRDALTLGAPAPPHGALAQLAALAALPPLDRGEVLRFQEALNDPLSLLELPSIPPELLDALALQQVGAVVGPRAAEVTLDQLTNANALAAPGQGVLSSDLLGVSDRGSIGNEPAAQQAADLNALLGTSNVTG